MDPREVYKNQRIVGWTRIDMLLALFEAAESDLKDAQTALQDGDGVLARRLRLRALRIVTHLVAGLNANYGELSDRLRQLYEYVQACLLDESASQLHSATNVLSTLRDGFEEIRGEAVRLESQGVIPPVEEAAAFERMA